MPVSYLTNMAVGNHEAAGPYLEIHGD